MALDIAVQSDGKVTVFGYANPPGGYNWTLGRLTPSGGADTSFDEDGMIVRAISTQPTFGGVTVQGDGRIVAAAPDGSGFTIVRWWP